MFLTFVRVPERKEEKCYIKEMMAKNFLNLVKDLNLKIQEVQDKT